MRILCALILVGSILSCKKDITPSNSIIGSWTWDRTTTGWGGLTESSPQHYQELQLTDNTHYVWMENGDVAFEGNYELYYSTYNSFSGQPDWVLTLEKPLYQESYILNQSEDSLVLREMAADGSTHSFHR